MSPINPADRNAIFSRIFGNNISRAREVVAAGLIRLRISPHIITVVGLMVSITAGFFLAFGAGDRVGPSSEPGHSWYGFTAGLLLILAAAFDILDGAVARISQHITKMGGLLDSCCDRVADAAVFIGILWYYISHTEISHYRLFALATAIALSDALIISYVKARAENFIDRCPVGYWQRGERVAGIFIGLFSGHMATVMVMLAVSSGFTVLRRLVFACRQTSRTENQQPLLASQPVVNGPMRWALWRYRRMSLPYDIVTAANISIILFVDLQAIAA